MTENYLDICLSDFDVVSESQFGRKPELNAIARGAKPLRKTVKAQEIIEYLQQWAKNEPWIQTYWLIPSLANLTERR